MKSMSKIKTAIFLFIAVIVTGTVVQLVLEESADPLGTIIRVLGGSSSQIGSVETPVAAIIVFISGFIAVLFVIAILAVFASRLGAGRLIKYASSSYRRSKSKKKGGNTSKRSNRSRGRSSRSLTRPQRQAAMAAGRAAAATANRRRYLGGGPFIVRR